MKKQLFLAIILFAAIIFATVFMVKNGPTPAKKTIEDTVQQVTAISLQPAVVSPTIHGYGEARPDKTWTALTRVAGTIREMLKSPNILHGPKDLLPSWQS